MILGEVEETVTVVEIDDETYEETSRSTKRAVPFLVRSPCRSFALQRAD